MKTGMQEEKNMIHQGCADSCVLIKVRGQLNDEKREQLREMIRGDLMRTVEKLKTPLMVEIIG